MIESGYDELTQGMMSQVRLCTSIQVCVILTYSNSYEFDAIKSSDASKRAITQGCRFLLTTQYHE